MNATATPALTLTPHVSLYALRQHPDFAAAKAGDISAALRLINDLLNPALLPLYTADAILAPVISEELSGFNAIPLALAIHLERQRGGIISTKILAHKAFHSNKNAMQRLLSPVLYAGPVQPHKDYIIIDDVVTTGSTLNDFKNYIHRHGGNVIAAICLVTAIHPVLGRTTYLSVTPKTLSRLLAKFGDDFPTFVKDQFGYEITQLSEGQAKYLLTFSSVHTIRSRAAASLGRLGADRRAQDCSRSDLSALALWAEKALSYGRAAVNTLHAPSLGEAAILRHNSATLDFNGFQPAYTRLESYDHLIDKASLQKVNYGQGGLKESLDIIRKYIRNYAPQVRKLAQHLRHPDTAQSCFNIWHFCKENIRYAFDAPGKEQLRTPARTWNDRLSGVDCDDFTIFCACLLQQMGIPWKLKLAAFHGRPNYSHIYLIVPTSGLSGTDKIVHPVPASHHTFRSFHEAEKWARQNITGKHFNHDLGEFIWISNNAISKFLSHSSVNKSAHPNVHLSALMILPQLIASAVVGQRHPDKKEAVDIKEILRLYAALVLDQVLYPVKITVKVFRNDNIHRAYNYEVIKVEMPEGKPVTSLFSDENRTSGISMSKLLQIIQSDNSPDAALSGPGCIVIDAVMNRFNADPPGITKSFTMDINGTTSLNGLGFRIRPIVSFALGHAPGALQQMQQLLNDLESKTQRSETEERDLRKLRVLLAMANTGESDAAAALLRLMPHILDVTPGGVIIWQHPVVQAVMAGDLDEEDLSTDMAQQLQPVLSLLQQISDPAEPAPDDAYLDAWLQGLEEWEDLNEGLGKKRSKAERKARRKKRRAKVKKVFNKIGTALKKIDPLLGTARGSFLLVLRFNWGALATKLYYLRENPAKKEAWKKIEKIWKGLGGGMKLLNKNIDKGWRKKPVTKKKQDKWKHFLALIEKIPGKGKPAPTPPVAGLAAGLGAAPVAAALAAAASIIGAISGVLGKFLKKEDNSPPDKEDQAMMAKAAKDPAIIQAFKQVFPEAVTDRPAAAASADAQPADTTGSKDSASTVSRKWLPWLIGGAALATTGTAILITKKSKNKKAA